LVVVGGLKFVVNSKNIGDWVTWNLFFSNNTIMKIVSITHSPLKTKRFRIYLDNNKHYDFGLKTGQTYIDHQDKVKRHNYQVRHYNLKKEQPFIQNLIASPALFSYYILWGETSDINKNIKLLNKLLKTK
jgi:hypothetical protein